MVRLFNVYHPSRTFVLICSEICLVALSYLSALFLMRGSESYGLLQRPAGLEQLLVVIGTCILSLYYFDLYNFQNITSRRELLIRLLQVLGMALLALAGIYYLFPFLIVARGAFLLTALILFTLLFGARLLFSRLNELPAGTERVALIGMGEFASQLVKEIRSRPELAMSLVGFVGQPTTGRNPGHGLRCIGEIEELEKVVNDSGITALVVALPDRRGTLPVDALVRLRVRGVRVHEASTVYEQITGKLPVDDLSPSYLIFSEGFRTHARAMFLQRIFSFFCALVGLVLSLPLLLLAAVAVKLNSRGPLIYKQERVGRNGKSFTIYKLRSMRVDAEKYSGAVWTEENDPRITRVGRILRKSRIDEIPQLWNVLRGDMNLVGPRPERPEFVSLLQEIIPYYPHRNVVRPGITGWAQVRFRYGSTIEDQKEKLRYDFFYIKNISLALDFYILFQTVKIVLGTRGAL
jgi:sugar transferase (PEP-CTERM system associated)